jgi:hypothetical protein
MKTNNLLHSWIKTADVNDPTPITNGEISFRHSRTGVSHRNHVLLPSGYGAIMYCQDGAGSEYPIYLGSATKEDEGVYGFMKEVLRYLGGKATIGMAKKLYDALPDTWDSEAFKQAYFTTFPPKWLSMMKGETK